MVRIGKMMYHLYKFHGSLHFPIHTMYYQYISVDYFPMFFLLLFNILACLSADEIMATLMPIFQSIRENQSFSTSSFGFLHPITDDKVTLSAHGCASHSISRKISAPPKLAFSTSTGHSTLPRVFGLLWLWFSFVLSCDSIIHHVCVTCVK